MPKRCLGLGRPGEKSHSICHLLSLFRWRWPGSCWGPCLVLGAKAVLVLSPVVPWQPGNRLGRCDHAASLRPGVGWGC